MAPLRPLLKLLKIWIAVDIPTIRLRAPMRLAGKHRIDLGKKPAGDAFPASIVELVLAGAHSVPGHKKSGRRRRICLSTQNRAEAISRFPNLVELTGKGELR